MKGILLVLSGPSGVGKGTIVKELFRRNPAIRFSVSATTRAPRPGEIDGTHYFFVSEGKFQEMVANDAFLEYANVHGNWYGTPIDSVKNILDSGSDVVLDIDSQGAMKVKRNYKDAVFVFLLPPSRTELEMRLRGRASDSEEQIQIRLNNSVDELNRITDYEYAVLNDSLDDAVSALEAIFAAERCRVKRGAYLQIEDLYK